MYKLLKNLSTLSVLILITLGSAKAQNGDWNLRLGGGYFVGGKIDALQGNVDITNGASFETGLQYQFGPQRYVGLRYLYAGTGLELNPYNEFNHFNPEEITMHAHFIGLAFTQYFTDNVAKPYFETSFNANINAPHGLDNQTFFSLGFGGGVSIELSEMVGLRLGGELQLPISGDGTGVYCGIGSYYGPNCGVSFNGGVIATQLNFGAAFTFDI